MKDPNSSRMAMEGLAEHSMNSSNSTSTFAQAPQLAGVHVPLGQTLAIGGQDASPALVNGNYVYLPHLHMDNSNLAANDQFHSVVNGSKELPNATLTQDSLKTALQNQLEYYFCRENLIRDNYLRSQMDSDQYVPISIIANFDQVKKLTTDTKLVVEVLRESSAVQVDESGEKVRPVSDSRGTLLLREIADASATKELEELFTSENCPKMSNLEYIHNESWYVTFESDDDAQRAYRYLREEVRTFQGKPIMARIKAKPMLSSPSYGNGMKPFGPRTPLGPPSQHPMQIRSPELAIGARAHVVSPVAILPAGALGGGSASAVAAGPTPPTLVFGTVNPLAQSQASKPRVSYANQVTSAVSYPSQAFPPFYPPQMLQAWAPAPAFDLSQVIKYNGLSPHVAFKPVNSGGGGPMRQPFNFIRGPSKKGNSNSNYNSSGPRHHSVPMPALSTPLVSNHLSQSQNTNPDSLSSQSQLQDGATVGSVMVNGSIHKQTDSAKSPNRSLAQSGHVTASSSSIGPPSQQHHSSYAMSPISISPAVSSHVAYTIPYLGPAAHVYPGYDMTADMVGSSALGGSSSSSIGKKRGQSHGPSSQDPAVNGNSGSRNSATGQDVLDVSGSASPALSTGRAGKGGRFPRKKRDDGSSNSVSGDSKSNQNGVARDGSSAKWSSERTVFDLDAVASAFPPLPGASDNAANANAAPQPAVDRDQEQSTSVSSIQPVVVANYSVPSSCLADVVKGTARKDQVPLPPSAPTGEASSAKDHHHIHRHAAGDLSSLTPPNALVTDVGEKHWPSMPASSHQSDIGCNPAKQFPCPSASTPGSRTLPSTSEHASSIVTPPEPTVNKSCESDPKSESPLPNRQKKPKSPRVGQVQSAAEDEASSANNDDTVTEEGNKCNGHVCVDVISEQLAETKLEGAIDVNPPLSTSSTSLTSDSNHQPMAKLSFAAVAWSAQAKPQAEPKVAEPVATPVPSGRDGPVSKRQFPNKNTSAFPKEKREGDSKSRKERRDRPRKERRDRDHKDSRPDSRQSGYASSTGGNVRREQYSQNSKASPRN
ncbi:La-related protein 4 [Halotydeus destructor]|nr:La-related protein 4 [Halotydeus destructor]